jgi:hypothetical protein
MLIMVEDSRQVCISHAKNCPHSHSPKVAPVVRFGGQTAICKASLRTQLVSDHFEILELQMLMRQHHGIFVLS